MKKLVLLRGAMGVGKSTFIKEHGLEPYTLSADNIRLLMESPILKDNGDYGISQKKNKEVWSLLKSLLEQKMQQGEFVVIDATHLTSDSIKSYKELSIKYRYRVYVVDFSNIPIETALAQNSLRNNYKIVPDSAIIKAYHLLETNKVPSFAEEINYKEAANIINLRPLDFSHYKKIHHIGDIHGCNTVLKEYLKDGLKEDELYIFLGDFVDRGIENAEVLNFMIRIMNKSNVLIIEGNHEQHLWKYANNEVSYSRYFEKNTKPEIEGNVEKKDIRRFYRKLLNVVYYTYHGKTIVVTHGGLPLLPENLNLISSNQLISGVGSYNTNIDKIFTNNNMDNNVYQIHGHRNFDDLPIGKYDKSFSVEGSVEFGGHLRVVTLDENGFHFIEVKNEVFKLPEHMAINDNVETLIKCLRDTDGINEKRFGNISSFNFKRNVFNKGNWDYRTIKARGLFVNTKTNEIVARGYEKFFNIGERPETELENLKDKFSFPVTAYVKENGYLGLIGYDKESDDFIFTSKSTITNEHSLWLKELFEKSIAEGNRKEVLKKLKEDNIALVFEVISNNDPHIIKYDNEKIVLLDIVKRIPKFECLDYSELINFSKKYGFLYKEKAISLNNWKEFESWYKEVTSKSYKYNGNHIEGFVISDSKEYMVKIKLNYYNRWKHLRTLKDNLSSVNLNIINDEESIDFLNWANMLSEKELSKDIVYLRDLWNQQKEL